MDRTATTTGQTLPRRGRIGLSGTRARKPLLLERLSFSYEFANLTRTKMCRPAHSVRGEDLLRFVEYRREGRIFVAESRHERGIMEVRGAGEGGSGERGS